MTNYIHSQLKLIQGTLMAKLEYSSSHLKWIWQSKVRLWTTYLV